MSHPSLENLKCPECSGPMVSRKNKQNDEIFWGCKNFPQCRGTRDNMGLSKREREAERYGREDDMEDE